MFVMTILYFALAICVLLSLYKFVLKPIIEAENKKEVEERKKKDEIEAKALARQAKMIGSDITEDIKVRLIQLEELSAQLQTLSHTSLVAQRIAEVTIAINTVKRDIGIADAKAAEVEATRLAEIATAEKAAAEENFDSLDELDLEEVPEEITGETDSTIPRPKPSVPGSVKEPAAKKP